MNIMNTKKSSFKRRFRIVWLFGIVCLILAIVHCTNKTTAPSKPQPPTPLKQAYDELKITYTSPDINSDRVTTDVLLATNLLSKTNFLVTTNVLATTNVEMGVTNVMTNVVTNVMTNVSSVSVAWTSSDSNVIAIDGTVNRPAFGESNAMVRLTATLSNAEGTMMRMFTLTVIALPDPNALNGPAVRAASDILMIGYNPPDTDSDRVTANVTLPTNVGDDVSVSWASSAPWYYRRKRRSHPSFPYRRNDRSDLGGNALQRLGHQYLYPHRRLYPHRHCST